MALQTTGAISLSDIQTEFGGTNPISMSEYYRGGGLVTSNNEDVPTSGLIKVSNFYGAGNILNMYEQVLSGSGTFTPLYANVPAIIQIGGGGGSGGWVVNPYDSDYPYNPSYGTNGAGDSIFVDDISDFSGGSYSIGSGGAATGGCFVSGNFGNGNNGTSTTFNSPSSSPYSITAGRGGAGSYYTSATAALPMSGTYPTGSSGLPSQVFVDGVITDTAPYMAISTGGAGSAGDTGKVTRPPEGGSIPGCAGLSSGGAGFIRIYYIVG